MSTPRRTLAALAVAGLLAGGATTPVAADPGPGGQPPVALWKRYPLRPKPAATPPSKPAPRKPAATTPAKPAATTPSKPAATTPSKPAATTPSKPTATTPSRHAAPSRSKGGGAGSILPWIIIAVVAAIAVAEVLSRRSRRHATPPPLDLAPVARAGPADTCSVDVDRRFNRTRFQAARPGMAEPVAATPFFSAPGGVAPEFTGRAITAHAALLQELEQQGWRVVSQGPRWFDRRLESRPPRPPTGPKAEENGSATPRVIERGPAPPARVPPSSDQPSRSSRSVRSSSSPSSPPRTRPPRRRSV